MLLDDHPALDPEAIHPVPLAPYAVDRRRGSPEDIDQIARAGVVHRSDDQIRLLDQQFLHPGDLVRAGHRPYAGEVDLRVRGDLPGYCRPRGCGPERLVPLVKLTVIVRLHQMIHATAFHYTHGTIHFAEPRR